MAKLINLTCFKCLQVGGIKMKIAIIDSGINANVIQFKKINQYRIYNNKIVNEECRDYIGHGTAVASIITKEYECEIVSICPGISDKGIPDKIISINDLVIAIEVAIKEKVDIINISMGTTIFSERIKLDEVCIKAIERGILIFCAESTKGYPSLPWACKGVIRVRSEKGSNKDIAMLNYDDKIRTCAVYGEFYRILTKEGKKYFASGHSYASPYLIGSILKKGWKRKEKVSKYLTFNVDEEQIFDKMIQEKIELIHEEKEKFLVNNQYGKMLLLPFIKEMHSLIRFNNKLEDIKVAAVVDSPKKGLINKDAGEVIGIEKSNIKIYSQISEVNEKIDTLVIGYLDQLQKFDTYFTIDNILIENLKFKKWNVFSFIPIDQKWVKIYKKEGIKIHCPCIIDEAFFNKVSSLVKYKVPISKPVIGVFGTSSSQGKFTLQLLLKSYLLKKGVKSFFLSTEHQAELLGADFSYADGYANDTTIHLNSEKRIDCIQRIMQYADNCSNNDIILVGGQSRLIPYNIEEQTFMRSAVFLEGVKPDLAIVVINPLIDLEDYIYDTIYALSSIYKCKTISLAYSDCTPQINESGTLKKKHLTDKEKIEISDYYRKKFNIFCGCITDSNYLEKLVEHLLNLLN